MDARDSLVGPARLDAQRFQEFVRLNAAHELAGDGARAAARAALLAATQELLTQDARAVPSALPRLIGEHMQTFGWAWNGYYVAHAGDELRLGFSHGPPVCTPLERNGGPLSSGMCFDALLLNQTLSAPDVKAWPGYLSCDSSSGLGTVSGIVCPLRDAAGVPIAVWDLDAVQPIVADDARFFDVFFATLAACVALGPALLEP